MTTSDFGVLSSFRRRSGDDHLFVDVDAGQRVTSEPVAMMITLALRVFSPSLPAT